jgi:putative nucleotidyltransferase with HDIG domain
VRAMADQALPTNPEQLVADIGDVVSFPEAAAHIIEVVDDSNSTDKQVAHALGLDPALAARVLRISNSAYYSTGTRVDSIDRAVRVLGRHRMRDVVLGISAIRAFEGIPIEVVRMDDFWSHSLYCGILAHLIAELGKPALTESAFTAGLLHDIGQLVLFMRAPEESRLALLRVAAEGDELTMADAETSIIGFSHMDVGMHLAKAWRLPPSLAEPIGFHHRPQQARSHKETVAIVHIANSWAVLAKIGSDVLEDAPAIDPAAWPLTGVTPNDVTDLTERAEEQFREIATLLFGP